MEFKHIPIMLNQVLDGLQIKPEGVYVDGTLGGAGRSYEIVKKLSGGGRLVGIDQDGDAIYSAGARLQKYKDRVDIVKSNYVNMPAVLDNLGIEKVDGILLDLGVSSYQFDNAERGFSYRYDAPLDMRMDRDSDYTAEDIVNDYSEEDLRRIIKEYGEDNFVTKYLNL